MKILLSPAKSIDSSICVPNLNYTFPYFHQESLNLVKKLAKMNVKKIMELMDVSHAIAVLNKDRFAHFALTQTPTELNKPAAYIFNGEVYKGLDIANLSEQNIQVAQKNIRILSGLYGLLKPLDLIYPYRLEMGTSLAITSKVKNLYQFWGDKIADYLQSELQKDEAIVNLASNEYFKAVRKNRIYNPIITPSFKEYKNGKFSTVMIFAKHARGAMARYIIENNIQVVEDLKNYTIDGYRFHESLSGTEEWVFTR